jgi:hypothetical protein
MITLDGPLAPVGPQAPPARAAALLVGALRNARGALPWTTGTTSTTLDPTTRK